MGSCFIERPDSTFSPQASTACPAANIFCAAFKCSASTKYRRQVFDQEAIQQLRQIFIAVCQDFEAQLIEMEGETEHVHLLVIMHIIGNEEYTDSIERIVLEKIKQRKQEFEQEEQRLDKLLGDNGIDELPAYNNPVESKIEISCPQLARFAAIIKQLDILTIKIDALWLNGILDNKQYHQANRQQSQRVVKLGNQIIGIEGHARKAIRDSGKQAEVIALPTEKIAL